MALRYYLSEFASLKALQQDGRLGPYGALLLAVLDLVRTGRVRTNRVYYDDALKAAFAKQTESLRQIPSSKGAFDPFYYLVSHSKFWHHKVREGKSPLYASLGQNGASEAQVKEAIEYASVDPELFEYFKSPSAREMLMGALGENLSGGNQEPLAVSRAGWSWEECEHIVADYFDMLKLELSGTAYNKAARNRALREKLENRTKASVERKHQNISAILMEAGMPIIDGYKPLSNYQRKVLPDVVGAQLAGTKDFERLLESMASSQVHAVPEVSDILARKVEAPDLPRIGNPRSESDLSTYQPQKVDYLAREKANAELGFRGEEFIVQYEKARLAMLSRGNLSERVVHESQEDDSLGYDIRSYEKNGKDRFIEVKTTNYARYTQFYVTKNELDASERLGRRYHLCRLFTFSSDPHFFFRRGKIDDNFVLHPLAFTANLPRANGSR